MGSVQAQDAPVLASVGIRLWPEYDRPDVLVIYNGTLAPDTTLPVPVDIPIPAAAGQPTAVAYVDEAGQLLNQPYTTAPAAEGDQVVVSFDLATLSFQLEYYVPLSVEDGQRTFTFTYRADYAVDALSVEVQEPLGAEGFVLEPDGGTTFQAGDGLTYHQVEAGALSPGEEKSWTLTYDKAGTGLTAPPVTSAPAAPAAGSASSGSGGNSTVLIFAIAFIALAAVGASAFWLGRRVEPPVEPTPHPKRRGSGKGPVAKRPGAERVASPPGSDGESLFCYQCGTPLRADAQFCYRCGAAVRDQER